MQQAGGEKKMSHVHICKQCPDPCCLAVKRIPFEAETAPELFSNLLIGALGQGPCNHGGDGFQRPFAVEWVIPGEAEGCPILTEDGICGLYSVRPVACRLFPRTSNGDIHPACPFGDKVSGEAHTPSSFLTDLAKFDAHLLNTFHQNGEAAYGELIGEERPLSAPLLYNGYLLTALLLAGVDLEIFFQGQRRVLRHYRDSGLDKLTFLIPDTDLEISGPVSGFEANLDWLALRVHEDGLARSCSGRLRALGLPSRPIRKY